VAKDKAPAAPPAPDRVMSIDALRGFDMFWIIGGNALVKSALWLCVAPPLLWFSTPPFTRGHSPLPAWLERQFEHVEWQGFSAWDLIMPLFLFIVGASMAFSFAKRAGAGKGPIYFKIVRRFLILFILGMAAQGRLLEFRIDTLHLYCNTLQAIAVGYLFASILLLNVSIPWQITSAAGLLVVYWLLMVLIPFGGHAKGTLEPHANLALYIDQALLGQFRDGTTYTWILSSMGFTATVLLGVFGGYILRSGESHGVKVMMLIGSGTGCLALGWAWSYAFPMIKHLWTSSMVLWAAGWSYLLLALFYGVIDVLGLRKWAFPFVVIGANAIFIYMATELLDFGANSDRIVGGLAHHLGLVGPFIMALAEFLLAWLILLYMYRNKTFIKV